MDDVDFRHMRLPFSADMMLLTIDGKRYHASREIPDGAPGGRFFPDAAASKFLREFSAHIGAERAERALSVIMRGKKPAEIMAEII
jgi:hypothetical protein